MEELKRIDLWSNCCSGKVLDPGKIGEWLCSDCKEHCSELYSQEVSVVVMDFNVWEVHHHIVEYISWWNESLDEFIQNWIDDKYSLSNSHYMYSEIEVVKIKNHGRN